MNALVRMKELIKKINEADHDYFGEDNPKISDLEYDKMVEELKELEKESGIVFATSPSKKVGGENRKELKSVEHTKPMLSCDKTKSASDIKQFANGKDIVASRKMDGLTLVLRYKNGSLDLALTRGRDGICGEDVTHTVKNIPSVPKKIPYSGELEVRGEGVASWSSFDFINRTFKESNAHPRSLTAGAVRRLDIQEGKLSRLDFFAFEIVTDMPGIKRKTEALEFLKKQGFLVVDNVFFEAGKFNIESALYTLNAEKYSYPVDGIVFEYDDLLYGKSLGKTAHHEKRMIALKWQDEEYETVFRGVELETTRTGLVSIVGIFDPVNMDGAMISRAYLHNLDVFDSFKFGIGDKITVYKANMIIPQIAKNKTRSGTFFIEHVCPACGARLFVKSSGGGVHNLYCINEGCVSRAVRKIERFCGKDGMNIEGMSRSTIERFVERGWIKAYADIYRLDRYRSQIIKEPGFGERSFDKLWDAIERSKKISLSGFLMGIGIEGMGPRSAAYIGEYFRGSFKKFENAIKQGFYFSHIAEVPYSLEKSIYEWYGNDEEAKLWRPLLEVFDFANDDYEEARGEDYEESPFLGTRVAITGTLVNYTRKEITNKLLSLGATVVDTVTDTTDYLIVSVTTGRKKLDAAAKYGTQLLSESDFERMIAK